MRHRERSPSPPSFIGLAVCFPCSLGESLPSFGTYIKNICNRDPVFACPGVPGKPGKAEEGGKV